MALCLGLAAASPASGAEPGVEITIQDQPRFEGSRSALGDDGVFEVSATLLDDTGAGIDGAEVVASTAAGRASLVECHATARPSSGRRGALRSDAAGRVCVRVVGASREGRVQLTFAGDPLHLPVSVTVALQPAPSSAGLAFDAPSLELDLDRATLRLRLTLSGGAAGEPIPAVELELHDGARQSALSASEWSRSGDALSFSIDTAQLGAPGPARLVARHVERDRVARAETLALRVATVGLGAEVATAEGRDGVDLRVWPRTRASASPTGWVEVTRLGDDQALGSAPFEGGSARVHLSETSGEVSITYHSDDPWWLPGEPLSLVLDPTPPRPPRRWPWLALLAPIGYVCLRSLQRPALRKPARRPPPRPRPAVPAAATPAPMSGWMGFVSDAHDGQPIALAEVRVLVPSYRGEVPAPFAVTDARGAFQLPPLADPLPEGARLRVSAPLHSDMERALPPQGRINIALTSRRRAVLRRLVRWARAAGAPWSRGGEPTPREVAAAATRRGDQRTARWAEDVEAAAFGDADVDASREASLRTAEPTWHVTAQHGETRDD